MRDAPTPCAAAPERSEIGEAALQHLLKISVNRRCLPLGICDVNADVLDRIQFDFEIGASVPDQTPLSEQVQRSRSRCLDRNAARLFGAVDEWRSSGAVCDAPERPVQRSRILG
jgi:hypothetical protein